MTEADTCRKFVVPLLQAAGWDNDPYFINPTKHVWYYEQPLPKGKKNYTKTAPIQFEEFAPLVAWWGQPGPGARRKENAQAWKVSAADLLPSGCNLDRKNPSAKEDIMHLPPEQLAASILEKEQRIAEIMGKIQQLLVQPSTK